MADYSIAAVTRRAVYTGSAGTGPYAFTFACLATSDIAVFKNTSKLTETSDYTVTLSSSTGQGSVTLDSAASGSDTITLVGARALARTTDFVTAGSLTASALNTDFDSLVIFAQQLSEENSRNLKAPVTEGISGSTDMTIPPKATRASKILEFDSDGNPAVSLTATGLSTLAGISGNITTVAGIAANVTTVAGISANVTTVAGISSNVTSVAAKASLITSDFVSDLNTLATSAIVTDLDILANADIVADLAILATSDVVADLNTLATSAIVADLNILATSDIVSDLNTLATADIVSDINTLATSDIVSDLNTLATSDIVTDINLLATSDIVSDLNTLATSDFVSDLNTLASSTVVANIATVATNVAGVNSFAARYRVAGSDPGSDNDAGDLFFNTGSNILKVYNGSSFDDVTGSTLAGLSDTNITSPADGSILLYDTGTSKYIDNVISGDATLADTGALTIAADAITSAKIADDAINSEHYVTGSIDNEHIADGTILGAKLSSSTAITTTGAGTFGSAVVKDTSDGLGGAYLDFIHDSSSPADNDFIMVCRAIGDNDAGETVAFATLLTTCLDVSDSTEDGRFSIQTMQAGTNAELMGFDENVNITCTSTADYNAALQVSNNHNLGPCQYMLCSHASFAADQHVWQVSRAGGTAYGILRVYTGNNDTEFYFRGDGNAFADNTWNANGADYAEYFEWKDGNSSNEDRRGVSVVIDNGKIRAATDSDAAGTIIGIISSRPAVVGDSQQFAWADKYEKNVWGDYVYETIASKHWEIKDATNKITNHDYFVDSIPDGISVPSDATDGTMERKKLNSSYDASLTYESREDRKEWSTVGLMGKLKLKSGQPTGTNWIKLRDITDSIEEWLVR